MMQKYFDFHKYERDINLDDIPIELLNNLRHNRLMELFGNRVWAALYNSNWHIRFLAAEAVHKYAKEYNSAKKSEVYFKGFCEIAYTILQDKVSQISMKGMEIVIDVFKNPQFGASLSSQKKTYLHMMIPIVIDKILGLNEKISNLSLKMLIDFYQSNVSFLTEFVQIMLD